MGLGEGFEKFVEVRRLRAAVVARAAARIDTPKQGIFYGPEN